MPPKQISSIDDAIRNFIETITSEIQNFKLALESTFELDSITPDQSLVSHDLPLQLPHLEKDSISEPEKPFSPLLPTPPPTLPNNSFPSSNLIVASSIFIPKSPNYHIIPFFGSNQDGFFHDLDWFHWTHRRQQLRNWASFMRVLERRFPPSTCVNHLAPNFKFKQTSTIIQYQREIDLYIIFYEQNKSGHHCTTAQFFLLQGDDDPPPPDLGASNPLFVRPLASLALLPSVQVWFGNVPHMRLVDDKGGQTWIAKKGKHKFKFSGGGTQFIHGADQYLDQISKMIPDITIGHHIRVVLDVGCGAASCGAYLLSQNVITMSIAPKDVQENQIQFAIECGVPAFATRGLLYPSQAFNLIHYSRCRINWTRADGILLSEVNRMLKAGGYFVWTAQPIYKHDEAIAEQWKQMFNLATRLCWNLVKKEGYIAIWEKPLNNNCYLNHEAGTNPLLCDQDDDSDNVWYVDMKACIISQFLENGYDANVASWPTCLQTPPDRLLSIEGNSYIARKELLKAESKYWNEIVASYVCALHWKKYKLRNILDMRVGFGGFGGFAAALIDNHHQMVANCKHALFTQAPAVYRFLFFGCGTIYQQQKPPRNENKTCQSINLTSTLRTRLLLKGKAMIRTQSKVTILLSQSKVQTKDAIQSPGWTKTIILWAAIEMLSSFN